MYLRKLQVALFVSRLISAYYWMFFVGYGLALFISIKYSWGLVVFGATECIRLF